MNWALKRELASESLYGGQFTLSTQLIKPDSDVIILPNNPASQFLLELRLIYSKSLFVRVRK